MQPLPPEIYLPIGAALSGVIALLWKRVSDLYGELIQDSKSLEAITMLLEKSAESDGQIKTVLDLIHKRLEELHDQRKWGPSSSPDDPTQS